MRKRFGQHFLIDEYTIDRIVELIDPKPGDNILEIGPGGGVLTQPLVASGATIVAIEIDRDLAAKLSQMFSAQGNFSLHNVDVLKFDIEQLAGPSSGWKIVGNLPYNISTPLIMKVLEHTVICSTMTFMLQQEVAQRLAAKAGSSAYGRLSVMAQRRAKIVHCLNVPARCFAPPPKVESAVVQLHPHHRDFDEGLEQCLAEIVVTAFSQRRKMLARSLRGVLSEDQFAAAEVDPKLRPEQLSSGEFERLGSILRKSRESLE